MWLTRFSIRRPLIVSMVFIGLAIFGYVSYLKLGRSAEPNVNFPVVVVQANYPGASPTEMEKLVIKPIEDQLDGIEHLDQMTATAQEGTAVVVVQFQLDTDLNYAAIDVQRRVDTARVYMPADLNPPSVYKNGADQAMLTYALSSQTMSGPALQDMVADRIVPEIKSFDNVSGVDIYGEPGREIQVDVDPLKLLAAGATITDIFNAISQNNANLPGGRMDSATQETSVSVHADVINAQDLASIPVPVSSTALAGGALQTTTASNTMLLGQFATVTDGHAEQRSISHFNGAPAVLMDVNRTVNSDEIATTKRAREQMKTIFQKYPQIKFTEVFAPADYTRASLNGVFQSLFEGIILTAVVLMLFLHAWRNAVVVMIAIPSSLLATFAVMKWLNFTLDNVSLMALSLIIGILVDDSIVVLENITRHRDLGQEPDEAAISGRNEIGGAAIAITLVDVVVFFPLAFLSGFVGKYFVEFGIVVTVATLFSLFVSFTLTPMLAAKWSVKRRSVAPPAYLAWFQVGFDRLAYWYRDRALPAAFRHRWLVVGGCVLTVFNALALPIGAQAESSVAVVDVIAGALCVAWFLSFRRQRHARASFVAIGICFGAAGLLGAMSALQLYVPFEFVPNTQQGQISGTVTFPTGTPLATTEAALERMEQAAMKVPYVESVRTVAGSKPSGWGSTTGGFVGRFNVTLDKNHRKQTDTTIDKLRTIFPSLAPGALVTVSERNGGGSGAAISYTLSGPDDKIDGAADRLAAFIRSIHGTTNVQTGAELEAPRLNIHVDPAKAAVVGVSPGAAATAARTAVGGIVATRVRTESGLIDVRLEYPLATRNSFDQIRRILVRSNDGSTLVPLSSVADFTLTKAPTKIDRQARERIARVNGDIDHSTTVTLGDITKQVDAKLAQPGFLPPGVTLGTQGDTKFFGEFLSSMGLSIVVSFALVYMLMVVLYGNFGTPLVIMCAIPVALVGAFFGLRVFGQTMNLFSVIGLIMLLGLVAKNGILLVDYANTLRKRGMRSIEAMTAAAGTRLRPILMTTAAMVFGMLPLALGLAEGGEIRKSMGVVLIGGLTSSLILTLFLVPVVYTSYIGLLERFADKSAVRRERAGLPPPPVPVGAGGD
ncbi:MAG: efflux RND transporter permease subunit [Candidatus Velthaea sp.]